MFVQTDGKTKFYLAPPNGGNARKFDRYETYVVNIYAYTKIWLPEGTRDPRGLLPVPCEVDH
jgi:hypothetical protein